MQPTQKETNYLGPFLTMVFLFLLIGFLTTANTQFQGPLQETFLSQVGSMKNTLATLITFSWFLAYPIAGKFGADWSTKYGHKGTLIRGLVVMGVGLFLFYLSSLVTVKWPEAFIQWNDSLIPYGFFIFLLGSFVVGASATILQVVINPYLSACHIKGTQSVQRMAMGGTANSIGTTIAPYFVTGVVFGGLQMTDINVSQLQIPFFTLAVVAFLILGLLLKLHLPTIESITAEKDVKLERSIWSFSHLRLGVIAIFFYVGCEVCIGGNLNLYVLHDLNLPLETTALMATLYWGGMLVGRLCGSSISKISPRTQLLFTTSAASVLIILGMAFNNPWILVAVGLFHSIMWGCIFTLSVAQLGKYTSIASGVFMIGVVGGAIIPLLQGSLADMMGSWRWSWTLVLIGELCMFLYGLVGYKVKTKPE